MISRNKKPKSYIDARENKSVSDHIAIKYFKRAFTAKAIFIPIMILFILSLRVIVASFFGEFSPYLLTAYSFTVVIVAILIYLFRSKTAFMDETRENYIYIISINIIGVLLATYIILLSGINHAYFLSALFAIYMYRLSYCDYDNRMSIGYFKLNNYLLLGISSMLLLSYIKGLH